jgi:hypothetical protein
METAAELEATLSPTGDEASADQVVVVPASTDPLRALANIAAQHAERTRRRRWRIVGQAALVLGVLTAALLSPRLREHGRAAAPANEAAPATARAGLPAATSPAPEVPAQAEQPIAPPPAVPEEPSARCESDFKARTWRNAIESCSAAFDATPSAGLAMRIAHAHYSHGDAASAATWASNALELGSSDPDAYVLIGNAELAAGKRRKAVAAYRHYLEMAPRGWHAARLRSVIGGAPAP